MALRTTIRTQLERQDILPSLKGRVKVSKPLYRADGRCCRRPSACWFRFRCRSASWKARRGRAVPARCADRRRWRADAWRRNGAARAALRCLRKAQAVRANVCIKACASRGLIGLPRRDRNSGAVGAPVNGICVGIVRDGFAHGGQHRHDAFLAAFAEDGERCAQRNVAALQAQALRKCASPRHRAA